MTPDRVLSVVAILGIGVPMLVLVFDYAVFAVLSLANALVHAIATLARHG